MSKSIAPLQMVGDRLHMDGQPFRLISGAVHYFRIVPEYWRDRLLKLKACGCNTVETYVAWNVHEPREGEFTFEGIADLPAFIRLAGELGLYVIVRPSPYICAEWEFGGLPAWLLSVPGLRLRCYNEPFLEKVDRYYDVLLPLLVPLQSTRGGPLIAMQIENEYGSYGNDQAYGVHLKESFLRRGVDVLLFTSDGPEDHMLQGGLLPNVWATVNFGSRPAEAFAKLQQYRPGDPLMCMEFWNGWFDHWGEKHHTREAADAAQALDEMLQQGASVNFYMFHGGTNFGFMSGANCHERYEPTVTSYDYDAAVSESGEVTEKFYAFRKVLEKHMDLAPLTLPDPIPKRNYGKVAMTERAPLFLQLDNLASAAAGVYPVPMEELGQNYGFILYRTRVSGPRGTVALTLQEVRDRATVYLNGEYQGVIERWEPESKLELTIPEGGAELSILVENMGRVNYGPHMHDHKGITHGVRLGYQFLYHWQMYPLPLERVDGIRFSAVAEGGKKDEPVFFRGILDIQEQPMDTFLDLKGWKKGVAFINGFNLGRYWEVGPQRTLYIPAPLLRTGENELILFELHGCDRPEVTLIDRPILDEPGSR